MDVTAAFQMFHGYEYWQPVINNGVTTWTKTRDGKGLAMSSGGQGLTLLTTAPMNIGAQVRNLTDVDGKAIQNVAGFDYPLYVHTADPQFDPYGRAVAWRHSLRRDVPRDLARDLMNTLGSQG